MAIIKKYRAEVVSVINPIEGVYTVEFRSLDKPFRYDPGQFLHLALDIYEPSGQWPDSRCFSIQSSSADEFIKITYAVKGRFTNRMQTLLQLGTEVILKLPYGHLFSQPHSKSNTIFIAGGTGITPFLSLFIHPYFKEYTKPILFAGFKTKKMNLYGKELDIAKHINPEFLWNFIYEDTDGRLNIHDIFKEQKLNSTFFISGPPIMIKSFIDYLISRGVDKKLVLTDNWE